ncbi:MAG TPA: hypothetical protein VII00_02580 [bacterium]
MSLVIGISFGDKKIGACLLETFFRGWKFLDFRESEIKNAGSAAEITQILKKMFTPEEVSAGNFLCSLPGMDVFYRAMNIQFSDPVKIQQAVEVEMDTLLPVPLEDIVVTWTNIAKRTVQDNVLAYGIKKEKILYFLDILRAAGIEPIILDWDAVSLLNLLSRLPDSPDGGLTGIIHLEDDRTILCFKSASGPAFARTLRQGADLPTELNRTLRSKIDSEKREIRKIFLSGHAERLKVVSRQLEQFFETTIIELMNFSDYIPECSVLRPDIQSKALLPLSIALRRILKKAVGGNFRRGEFAYTASLEEVKTSLAATGIIGCIILALGIGNIIYKYVDRKTVYKKIQSQLSEVCSVSVSGYDPYMDCAKELKKAYMEKLQRRFSRVKAVDILREFSVRVSNAQIIDISEVSMDGEKIKIKGTAPALEIVEKIKNDLSKSELFGLVEIIDSKKSIDGASFGFSLTVTLKPAG